MRLPYLGTFSNTLRGVLKTVNCRPAYSLNTTRQNLCRLKDPIPQTQRSGVYRITCGDVEIVLPRILAKLDDKFLLDVKSTVTPSQK